MKRLFFILSILVLQSSFFALSAQPQKSRVQQNNSRIGVKRSASAGKSVGASKPSAPSVKRADIMFPTAVAMPEEVVWRRDLYRSLDLTKSENSPLYYPILPEGKKVNLYTLLFSLFRTGRIPVYEYDTNLDGKEDFSESKRMNFRDFCKKYKVTYTEEGGSIKVNPNDVQAEDVQKYFIKESNYYDQVTATYHVVVDALCPIKMDIFGEKAPQPLFWVRYKDVEQYLSAYSVSTSEYNNAAVMSMADFFATNHYKGELYRTSNNIIDTETEVDDSTSVSAQGKIEKPQDKIEKQMAEFEKHIWTAPVDSAALARKDSIARSQMKKTVVASNKTRRGQSSTGNTTTQKSEKKEKAPKSSSGSSAPRASVRRQRH